MKVNALTALCIAVVLGGCQTLDRPDFSREDLALASPELRFESGNPDDGARFLADLGQTPPKDGTFDLLALSSGGANGAFGAGVLVGWTARGDRPEFEVVTGVSIGALMAPFVFVGPERDEDLQAVFTDGRTQHMLRSRGAMSPFGPALYRSGPLRKLVEEAVDDRLLSQVAHAHRQGRRLYVATTSLDTREQVIWDLGALAASNAPDRRERFASILVAASSVPGAFQPVLIDLDAHGRRARELHVDGRLSAGFFVAPESVLAADAGTAIGTGAPGRIWVIVNGSPGETFSPAPNVGFSLMGRSLETLLNASMRSSLISTSQFARLHGMNFAAIHAGLAGEDRPFDFDRARMNRLFDEGLRQGRDGGWTASTPAGNVDRAISIGPTS